MARRTIAGLRGILTGGSSGIGEALARELVAGGAKLLVVARREERLRQLADSLSQAAGRIEILAGDITDPAVRSAAVARAVAEDHGAELLCAGRADSSCAAGAAAR